MVDAMDEAYLFYCFCAYSTVALVYLVVVVALGITATTFVWVFVVSSPACALYFRANCKRYHKVQQSENVHTSVVEWAAV